MSLLHFLLLFGPCLGQTLTLSDLHERLSSMETKMQNLESEVKMLKTKNDNLRMDNVMAWTLLSQFQNAQNEINSKIDQMSRSAEKLNEISAFIEKLKNTPKAVVAFRATCAKNFPRNAYERKSENPGKSHLFILKFIESPLLK